MLLAVRISSYGCTWEVWRTLKKLELFSAAPRATLTLLSCSLNFPRASITRYTHAKHEPILNCTVASSYCEPKGERKDCFKKTILVLSVQNYFRPKPRWNPWFISFHTHSILSTHSIPHFMPTILIHCALMNEWVEIEKCVSMTTYTRYCSGQQ